MTRLFACRVVIGDFIGGKKPAMGVTMREATAQELATIANSDPKKAGEEFLALLPKLIIDSGFTEDGNAASVQEVAALIASKGTLFSYVLQEWQGSLPLAKGKSTKSGR